MNKPLTPEWIVELLNDAAYDQTVGSHSQLVLQPYEYLSDGNNWVIQIFGIDVAGSEDQGSLDPEALRDYVIAEVDKVLESARRLKAVIPYIEETKKETP